MQAHHQDYQSQSLSAAVGDTMFQQLLANTTSTSSSSSSTSSSTWRQPTSTSELCRSTTATTRPPATRPGRPLPALPHSFLDEDRNDLDLDLDLGDDLSAAVPRVDADQLRRVDTLGAGHFGEVHNFHLKLFLSRIIQSCTWTEAKRAENRNFRSRVRGRVLAKFPPITFFGKAL